MSEYLLSIVTVTWNCAQTIEQTLLSVRAIKQDGVEYIVIDGGSTDGTLDVVGRFGDLVDRIVSEPDSGIYNAMNKGVNLARGRYVLFINGDDELVSDGFPAAMDAMSREMGRIICATTLVGEKVSPDEILVAQPWRLPFFNSIPHPSSFVRRELLLRSPFKEDLRIVSDYDFFLHAYLARESFYVLPVVTALHQRGGASGDVQRSLAELERVRRDRLGWRYPFVNGLAWSYRQVKHLLGRGLA
jgi:glycosyltransferase involved in cell wall biosynthesis